MNIIDIVTNSDLVLGIIVVSLTFIIWRFIDGSKLKPVGQVTGLNIFPVKSIHALKLDEVRCTEVGFYDKDLGVYDR